MRLRAPVTGGISDVNFAVTTLPGLTKNRFRIELNTIRELSLADPSPETIMDIFLGEAAWGAAIIEFIESQFETSDDGQFANVSEEAQRRQRSVIKLPRLSEYTN